MENVIFEVPANQKELFEDLTAWEPAQMKKDFQSLIFYFAIQREKENDFNSIGIESAFSPSELNRLLFRLKSISDSIN